MGAGTGNSGTNAPVNQGAVQANNQAQQGLQSYAGAGANSGTQGILGQYAQGGMSLQQALSSLNGLQGAGGQGGSVAANGVGSNGLTAGQTGSVNAAGGLAGDTSGLSQHLGDQNLQNGTNNGGFDTSSQMRQGAIDQLFTSPETAGLAAQSQVQGNSLYSGMFGPGGQLSQETGNLAQDRQALSGNDPSYGLQASDLAAYGQASNNIGRQAAQQNQGIAQSLAARGLGSSNNGSAIGSYAGAYGNQNEALAGLQQNIAQQRIQTAQGLATARNNSDMQQQQYLGNLANSAYNSQLSSNMQGAENNYNMNAGAAGAALNNQAGQQNINNSTFAQQQQTAQPGLGQQIGSALGTGLSGGLSGVLSGGLTKALGPSTPTPAPAKV